jgi:hypothetical protein
MNHRVTFHRNVNNGIPNISQTTGNTIYPTPSKHAIDQARYKQIEIPKKITYDHNDIVELYMTSYSVDRIVIRTTYDNRFDLVSVYSPTKNRLITLWLNSKSDNHKTLNTKKYT